MLGLVALAFGFQGSRGLWEPDEGYYVSTALTMLETGDLLIPRLNYEPFIDKPPLGYWGIVAGMKLLGRNEWGARAFPAFCYMTTVLLVGLLGSCLFGERSVGIMAGIIYATTVIPFAAANVVTPDTPLALWTTAAFYAFWKSVAPNSYRGAFWKMLMCAAFGLGFLTKGPAALIPASAMFVYLLLQRRTLRYFLTPWAPIGLVIFCALGLSWYFIVARALPDAGQYFWDNQIWGRTISEKYHRNPGMVGALKVYPAVLALGTLPWCMGWLPWIRRDGRGMFTRSWWTGLRMRPVALFLVTWFTVPLVILCLASSKLPLYALPLFPAFALATARVLLRTSPARGTLSSVGLPVRLVIAVGIWVVVLGGLKAAVAGHTTRKDSRALWQAIQEHLPEQRYELLLVDEKANGLWFYGANNVESITLADQPYPFFILPESVEIEMEELQNSAYYHVFLCSRESRAEHVRQALDKVGVLFREIELPYGRRLLICEPAAKPHNQVRLAVVGDVGTGRSSEVVAVASGLHRLYGERSFEDGVLLLGDNFCIDADETEDLREAAERYFEQPYKVLLDDGVPFYAILGNHDYNHGLEQFEIAYPPFQLAGRHYYSKTFGNHLVEVFFLDSQMLRKDRGDQMVWIEETLRRSDATWKVVAIHSSIYSTALRHPSDPHLIALLEPLFIRYGVSMVLQGDNHLYERLLPIHGIHYFTVGSGGKLDRGGLEPHSRGRVVGNDQANVFLLLEFEENLLSFTAYDAMRRVVDEGTIPNAKVAGAPEAVTASVSNSG